MPAFRRRALINTALQRRVTEYGKVAPASAVYSARLQTAKAAMETSRWLTLV